MLNAFLPLLALRSSALYNEDCYVTSNISCKIIADGRDCFEIIPKPQSCETIEVLFKFSYCNTKNRVDESLETAFHYVGGEMNVENGKLLSEPIDDGTLDPETCRIVGHVSKIDSCLRHLEASMEVEAWEDDKIVCTSSDFYKFVKPMIREFE